MSIMATDREQSAFAFIHRRDLPFNDLPPLPPRVEVETRTTLKKAIRANKALAELRGAGRLIPDQSILIRSLVLQEARLSSEIENIVTTSDRLYRAFDEDPEKADPQTKEVLRYGAGLWRGYSIFKERGVLAPSAFVEIVREIKQIDLDVRDLPGTQVQNHATKEAIYTPPVGEDRIRGLLHNLADYLNDAREDEVDPLIKMAVAHYQFEAIHPFPDGNGRTGRVINILYLLTQGLLDIPTLYLSQYILANKKGYYEGLQRVTEEEAWEPWILYMLDAVERTALETAERIQDVRLALDEACDTARRTMGRRYNKEMVELIFQSPYTRISTVEEAGIAKRQAASEYLKELEGIGLLQSFKVGRDVLFLNQQLLDILAA